MISQGIRKAMVAFCGEARHGLAGVYGLTDNAGRQFYVACNGSQLVVAWEEGDLPVSIPEVMPDAKFWSGDDFAADDRLVEGLAETVEEAGTHAPSFSLAYTPTTRPPQRFALEHGALARLMRLSKEDHRENRKTRLGGLTFLDAGGRGFTAVRGVNFIAICAPFNTQLLATLNKEPAND